MIALERVFKTYGAKTVLSGFSMELPDRGVVALTGPNGSGKTTVLRLLAGLEQPDSGRILLPEPCRVAYVFQDYRLLPALSVRKNVRLVLPKNRRSEADAWLEAVGLTQNAGDLPRSLSGGMQQRAAIARALACGSELLLLDEPFAALDTEWHWKMLEAVRLAGERACVVLTTHDPDDLTVLGCASVRLNGPQPQNAAE